MKHKVEASKPKLIVLMRKHVDDLKLIGMKEERIAARQQTDHVFGKLKTA